MLTQLVGDSGVRHTEALAQLTAARVVVEQPLQHGLLKTPENLIQAALYRELAQRLRRAVVRQADMFALDHPAIAKRNGLKQHVLQLTHITRPVVVTELIQYQWCQLEQRATDLPTGL